MRTQRYTSGGHLLVVVVKRRTIRNANRGGVSRRGTKGDTEGYEGRDERAARKGGGESEDSLNGLCLLPVRRVFAYPRHDQDPICIAPMKLLLCAARTSSTRLSSAVPACYTGRRARAASLGCEDRDGDVKKWRFASGDDHLVIVAHQLYGIQ